MNTYNARAKAKAEKRRARVLRLRQAGLTLERIGDRMGISKQRVSGILAAVRK